MWHTIQYTCIYIQMSMYTHILSNSKIHIHKAQTFSSVILNNSRSWVIFSNVSTFVWICTQFIKFMLNFGRDNWTPLFIRTTVPRYKQPWARLSSQTIIILVLSSELVFKVTTKHSSWNHHLPLEKGYIHHFTATNFT